MSKKHKKSKRDGVCLACGKELREKWPVCRKCGRANPMHEIKKSASSPAFIGKGRRARCVRCMTLARRPGQAHCTRCGSALLYAVSKSAASRDMLSSRLAAEPDPAQREYLWKTFGPQSGGVA
ncbi:MAG: hypothetical protein ACYCVZ_16010 [Streptosporangiaceae bacterium]